MILQGYLRVLQTSVGLVHELGRGAWEWECVHPLEMGGESEDIIMHLRISKDIWGYPVMSLDIHGCHHVSKDRQGNPRASYDVPGSPRIAQDILGHTNVCIRETQCNCRKLAKMYIHASIGHHTTIENRQITSTYMSLKHKIWWCVCH